MTRKATIIKRHFPPFRKRFFRARKQRQSSHNGANINEKDVIITLQIHYILVLRNKLVGTSFVTLSLFVFMQSENSLPPPRDAHASWKPRKELNLNNFPLFSSAFQRSFVAKTPEKFVSKLIPPPSPTRFKNDSFRSSRKSGTLVKFYVNFPYPLLKRNKFPSSSSSPAFHVWM